MKKKDILKILEESNKVLGYLTDKQLENYASENRKSLGLKTINENRSKSAASKGGKKGGVTTGNKIKNGEKIGFHAIPLQERIEKYYSKPRPKRRLLSEKEQKYIQKVYYRTTNQYDKIPKGKKSMAYLMNKFNVGRLIILKCLRNDYKK